MRKDEVFRGRSSGRKKTILHPPPTIFYVKHSLIRMIGLQRMILVGCLVGAGSTRAFVPSSPAVRPLVTPSFVLVSLPRCNPLRQRQPSSLLIRSVSSTPPESVTPNELGRPNQSDIFSYWILPLLQFVGHSLLLATLLVAWEDLTCTNALSSRHARVVYETNTPQASLAWGQVTVRGLAFGQAQREQLLVLDDDSSRTTTSATSKTSTDALPSYNEIMLQHRSQRLPAWKQQQASPNTADTAAAIHTLLICLQDLRHVQALATDYQWTAVRQALATEPWTNVNTAAARLRPVDKAVGFEWGSCAWRHCGALADAQEALDELDSLLGVLEPFEALFCLDIVERSLRDMLVEAPWTSVAAASDLQAWKDVPAYQPHRIFGPPNDAEGLLDMEIDESWRVDEEYLRALREFRID